VSKLWDIHDRSSVIAADFNLLKAKMGFFSVEVLKWNSTKFTPVPGTERTMPNGIVISRDESHFYVNMSASGTLEQYLLDGGKP